MESPQYKYWAFLSYSHADEAWARWLHRALERYVVPKRLVGRNMHAGLIPRRLFPIFRDRDELAGSAHLAPELQQALAQSRYQIVVCSPRSARSRWVNEEIKYFKSLGRGDRVLALIVDGEPHASEHGASEQECFPEALRFGVDPSGTLTATPAEPIAADARKTADGRHNATLKLVAGILGVGFDELKQRDLHARNQRLALISGIACAIAAVTMALAVVAYRARNDALRRREQAEDLIQFMLGDLREKLEPIGKLAILDAVGQKAMGYFENLSEADRTDAALASRAKAMRQIGEVRLKQGDLGNASKAFEESVSLDRTLLERHPEDTARLQSIAESEFAMGNAHYLKGEFTQAQVWIERNAVSAARLVELDPGNPKWLSMLADAQTNLGGMAFQRGDADQARDYFRAASAAEQKLVDAHPDDAGFVQLLAEQHGWLAAVEASQRRWRAAVEETQRESEVLRELLSREPDNANYRERLAAALIQHINNRQHADPPRPGDPALAEALALSKALADGDRDNLDYERMYRICITNLEEAHIVAGDLRRAAQLDHQTLTIARSLRARSPDRAELADDLLRTLLRSIKLAALRNDRTLVRSLVAEARGLSLTAVQRAAIPTVRWLELEVLAWASQPASERPQIAQRAADLLANIQASGAVPPDLMARYELLSGHPGEVKRWVTQLEAAERAHPFIAALCAQARGCAGTVTPRLRPASTN